MGKRSVKENKSIYQICREELSLTREQASELLEFISESRVEKIENHRSAIYPDEVLAMAKVYKKPSLCNYYCTHECPIGQEYIPEIEIKDISQIVVELLSSMQTLIKNRDRLIDIIADEKVDDEELVDFIKIQDGLEKVSLVADTMRLWVENTIASGKISEEKIQEVRAKLNK